jgi:hypothetical protein
MLIHYELETLYKEIIWPTVDTFKDPTGRICIAVTGYTHDAENDVSTTISGVVPLQLALDNDVDAILEYVRYIEDNAPEDNTEREVTVH